MKLHIILLAASLGFSTNVLSQHPTGLRVNHLVCPMGMDDASPLLEWTPGMDDVVSSRVFVGTDSASVARRQGNLYSVAQEGDGRLLTLTPDASHQLQPFTRYYWAVDITDRKGESYQSAVSTFATGMMGIHRWQGSWISDRHDTQWRPAPYFRRVFKTEKEVKKAELFIAVGGLCSVSVNGQEVTTSLLTPAFTRYDQRISYLTYDVTPMLRRGDNVVGVVLGNGWYNHQALAVWNFHEARWRSRPAFCLDLRITYADGTTETIPSDLSWRTSEGPLVYNNIYTGEHYDFRRHKLDGWNLPGYDDGFWEGVSYRQAPSKTISSEQMVPIARTDTLPTRRMTRINDTTYVFDFGRTIAGIVSVRLRGEEGTRVRLIHGERLKSDGSVDMSNIDVYYRGDREKEPFQTDVLWLDGGDNKFEPRFSYKGFRYVQVESSNPINLTPESLTAYFVHSDVPEVGSIDSSNPLLNGIVAATRASYLSNLMGYPTDCPQREKNGWTGDAHLAIETAFYNFDAVSVYAKWMQDHRDEQQPNGVLPDIIPTCGWGYGTDNGLDWTSTIAIIPWEIYLFYGDASELRRCYDNIKRYVDYVDRNSPSHLSSWGRGDWVPVKSQSEKEFTSSVYFFVDATILAKAAKLLGHQDDARHYATLASQIRDALNNKYLHRDSMTYSRGTQTELSMALLWGIAPDELKKDLAARLADMVKQRDYHLDVGVLGAKAILYALSENGQLETAYKLAVQDSYPSWGWWVKNGATTLHENWDLNATRDISDNHIMFGEMGAWPYKGLGGIYPDERQPGFKHIILRPGFVKDLSHFTARHKSPYGEIVSSWKRKGKKVIYTVDIPKGSSATLYLPQAGGGERQVELKSGHHVMKL